MTTTIVSNGSKWAGQEPDSVEELLRVLALEPLDPRFEDYGNFFNDTEPTVRFFGNFEAVSHVFNITSDDPAVIAPLTAAITANRETKAYKAAAERLAARKAREEAERRAIDDARRSA